MYDWAKMAKIINGDIEDQLRIVYEPDCASLSLQHAIFKNNNNDNVAMSNNTPNKPGTKNVLEALCPTINIDVKLKSGDKYILIDIGGGTCDFACHKIENEFAISELFHPSGGDWGSTNIDKKFTYYIDEIFGIAECDLFKKRRNGDDAKNDDYNNDEIDDNEGRIAYLQFLINFETAKREFSTTYMANNFNNYHFAVEIPNTFVTYLLNKWDNYMTAGENSGLDTESTLQKLESYLKKKELWKRYNNDLNEIKTMIKSLDINNITQYGFEYENSMWDSFVEIKRSNEKYCLSLHYNIWFLMFNETIEPIVKHCDKLLKMNGLKDTKYIFLVGGFAASKYFQDYIKQYFKEYVNIKIVVPNLPGLCVVDGASKYGLYPNFVKIRKMPKHYGIQIARKISEINQEIPKEWIQKNTKNQHGELYVFGLFSKIVQKNDCIGFDDKPIIKEYRKRNKNDESISIYIYSSTEDNPLTIDKCNKLGSFSIPIAKDVQKLFVEFIFGKTILHVFAYEKGNRGNKKEISIDCFQ